MMMATINHKSKLYSTSYRLTRREAGAEAANKNARLFGRVMNLTSRERQQIRLP